MLRLLVTVWATGWLVYGTRHWLAVLRERRRDGEPLLDDLLPTIALSYAIHLVVWPAGLNTDLEECVPKVLIALRLRPAWSVLRADEDWSRTWRLKDGKELSVSALGTSAADPARIFADGDVDAVEFRLKRIAPVEAQPTTWRPIPRMSQREWGKSAEDEDDSEEKSPFEAAPLLERGRYVVDFRIQNESGEYEECTGIPLVVY